MTLKIVNQINKEKEVTRQKVSSYFLYNGTIRKEVRGMKRRIAIVACLICGMIFMLEMVCHIKLSFSSLLFMLVICKYYNLDVKNLLFYEKMILVFMLLFSFSYRLLLI